MSLRDELAEFAAAGKKSFDPNRAAIYAKQSAAIAETPILDKALRTGDTAPMFELPDAYGRPVRLQDLLAAGPVILSFYRGSWCPFCNLELRALQRELDNVVNAGARLVAISPNRPDISVELIDKLELTFPVLSDRDNRVGEQFGLVYEVIPEQRDLYLAGGRDLRELNGSERWTLPVPATYVIDRAGTIRFDFIDLNHRVRAEPSEVVAVAESLPG